MDLLINRNVFHWQGSHHGPCCDHVGLLEFYVLQKWFEGEGEFLHECMFSLDEILVGGDGAENMEAKLIF